MDRATRDPVTAPNWPKVLSLTAHELRSPLSVVAGYIRMLLRDRNSPPSDQHRRLLEEAEKSCGRLSALLAELSELSQLEAGAATFNRATVDLKSSLDATVAALPPLPDRDVSISVAVAEGIQIHGDAVRLRSAFASLLHAIRREIVASDRMVVSAAVTANRPDATVRLTIGEADRMSELAALDLPELVTFDEWRGGNGLALPNARRIIDAHHGMLFSPPEGSKASAVVILPLAAAPPR